MPEQSGDNNHGRCFNWFRPAHTTAVPAKLCRSARWSQQHRALRFRSGPRVHRRAVRGRRDGRRAARRLSGCVRRRRRCRRTAGWRGSAHRGTGAHGGGRPPVRARTGPSRSERGARRVSARGPACRSGTARPTVSWIPPMPPSGRPVVGGPWPAPAPLQMKMAPGETWGSPARPAVELWMLPDLPHGWPTGAAGHIAQFWGPAGGLTAAPCNDPAGCRGGYKCYRYDGWNMLN